MRAQNGWLDRIFGSPSPFDLPNVHVLRTLEEADSPPRAAGRARSAGIVGASFIGLEVAAIAPAKDLAVHVVAPYETPLAKWLGPEVGQLIRRVHEERGVRFHLGRQAVRFDGRDLVLDDDSSVSVDLLVLGVGVTPRTAVAQEAGLNCAPAEEGGGIRVNQRLESCIPGILAIGEIARYPDPHSDAPLRVEHWVHAKRQVQHVARVLPGQASRYVDVPFFWSAHFDTGVRYLGHVASISAARTEGSIDGREVEIEFQGTNREKARITCNRDKAALQREGRWDEQLAQREAPHPGEPRL